MDGITLINTPSGGGETSHLLTVRLLKVGASHILVPFVDVFAAQFSVRNDVVIKVGQSRLLFCIYVRT